MITRDLDLERRARIAITGTGFKCRQKKLVQLADKSLKAVPCRKCDNCVKLRKMAQQGRAIAEARASAMVAFVTLTYRPGELGAEVPIYADVQAMLRLMRQTFRRNGWGRLRFLAALERGGKGSRRLHWHLLLFFEQDVPLTDWNRSNHRNELWQWWPHGWADVKVFRDVNSPDVQQAIRYVVKYAIKAVGDDEAMCRLSTKPVFGALGVNEYARDRARAGLPMSDTFKLSGAIYTRGPNYGRPIDFPMYGAVARDAAIAYVEEWEALFGVELRDAAGTVIGYEGGDGRAFAPVPPSDFLLRNHPEAVQFMRADRVLSDWRPAIERQVGLPDVPARAPADLPAHRAKRARDRAALEPFGPPAPVRGFPVVQLRPTCVPNVGTRIPGPGELWPEPPRPMTPREASRALRPGWLPITGARGELVAMVEVERTGRAFVALSDGDGQPLEVARDLRGLVELSDAAHDEVAAWIADRRGPDWAPAEPFLARVAAKRDAYVRQVNERAVELLGEREAFDQLRATARQAAVAAQWAREAYFGKPDTDYGPGPFVPLGAPLARPVWRWSAGDHARLMQELFGSASDVPPILSDAQLLEDQAPNAQAPPEY